MPVNTVLLIYYLELSVYNLMEKDFSIVFVGVVPRKGITGKIFYGSKFYIFRRHIPDLPKKCE